VTDLSGSINAMMLEASETFDAEAPRDGADRLRYANSILTSYLASTGTIEARPSLETSFGSAHDTRHLNTSCAPGFQPTAIDSRYCSPCPVGYHGDDASVSGCSRCPPGTYQSTAGQLTCAKCPGDTHVTGTHGSTRADECRVPKLSLRPTLPTRCIPPGCTAGPHVSRRFPRRRGGQGARLREKGGQPHSVQRAELARPEARGRPDICVRSSRARHRLLCRRHSEDSHLFDVDCRVAPSRLLAASLRA